MKERLIERTVHGVFIMIFFLMALAVFNCSTATHSGETQTAGDVDTWLTTGDRKHLLDHSALKFTTDGPGETVIRIDTASTFQSMDGFGFSLTGGSAYLLHTKLDPQKRKALLKELFTTEGNGIGISYLRISIGASDLDDHVFSYASLHAEKPDVELNNFSLDEDRKHLIPVLKEILTLNPHLKIMGSPWSAPVWMKDNQHPKGGRLKREYYSAYANYLLKYIREMEKEGISIDAITIQNEPENPKNTPSMVMTAEEQAAFVKNDLGPTLRNAGVKTKIVVFDHNCDHPEYPITVLNDKDARQYIDGSAFHMYLGKIEAMSQVHDAHPDKHVYFTEQWTSGNGEFAGDLQWHTTQLVIGATRNWSRNVLEWNLASDPQFNPHTDDGGCTLCQGALTIGNQVTRNVSYYIIAHASKFVPPGSIRIGSNLIEGVPNVAFKRPDGKKVLIAANNANKEQQFVVTTGAKSFNVTLPENGVATFVW
jgi:glucosylceramidase